MTALRPETETNLEYYNNALQTFCQLSYFMIQRMQFKIDKYISLLMFLLHLKKVPPYNTNKVLCCTGGKPHKTVETFLGSQLKSYSWCHLVRLTLSFSYFRRRISSKSNSCSLLPPTAVPFLPSVNVTLCPSPGILRQSKSCG